MSKEKYEQLQRDRLEEQHADFKRNVGLLRKPIKPTAGLVKQVQEGATVVDKAPAFSVTVTGPQLPLYSFELPFPLASVNDILELGLRDRLSWKKREKRQCGWAVKDALKAKPFTASQPVAIRYTVFLNAANRDPDNVYGRHCTDQMVAAGMLRGDRCKQVRESRNRCEYLPAGRSPFTLVEIFPDSEMVKPGTALKKNSRKRKDGEQ